MFTPSPFARRPTINVGDKFVIHRELGEGDNDYGMRRYLLLPRPRGGESYDHRPPPAEGTVASLNANGNVIFGARMHARSSSAVDDGDGYLGEYLAACGTLLDVAMEDAAMNGQQVQALCALDGLCAWVRGCLDKDGEGSDVLTGLMHGYQQPNRDDALTITSQNKEKRAPVGGKRSNTRVKDASVRLVLKKEAQRMQMLEAVRAIATGVPRPGHSDGRLGWIALAREYGQLASATTNDEGILGDDLSYNVGRRGLEEMVLYKSRGGEVTKIEHLAHTHEEYLGEAGGAMARLFFV